jgi:hypothetical protein
MVRRSCFPLILALALALPPALARAAADDQPAAAQAEDEADSKSYLPPWMQKPQGVEVNAPNEGDKSAAAALAAPETNQPKPPLQRPVRRYRNNDNFLRGFVGLFGR